MENKNTTIVVILSCLALLLFSGCTANKYVPCCAKDMLYNRSAGQMLLDPPLGPGPHCYFPNGTQWDTGGCLGGPVGLGLLNNGTAACTQGATCGSLNEQECALTWNCYWNGTLNSCTPGTDTAYSVMPVCVDDAPQSCVNNRCTAMMCGITDFSTTPPPSSADWNADSINAGEDALPTKEMSTMPKVNLQGTACEFRTMNKRLFSEVTKSKGSIWVNAFRFGVGSSFSDFEQAKYFFPASDRLCGLNPSGTIDRFTTYLNAPSSWCGPVNNYYHCAAYDLNFTNATICLMYCDGLSAPADCNYISTEDQYACAADKFAYSSQDTCRAKCGVIADPSACTVSNATAPFLQPDGRYPVKYIADYMTDTNRIGDQGPSDRMDARNDVCWSGNWRDPPGRYWCDDWYQAGGVMSDGPWAYTAVGDDPAGYTQQFEERKSVALEFDDEYYTRNLRKQYEDSGKDPNYPYPFECTSSSECISSVCDNTKYSRGLCRNFTDPSTTIDCGCKTTWNPRQQISCENLTATTLYAEGVSTTASTTQTEIIPGLWILDGWVGAARAPIVASDMFLEDHKYSRSSSPDKVFFRYYSLDVAGQPKPKLFEKCAVPSTTVEKCVFTGAEYTGNGLESRQGRYFQDPVSGSCAAYAEKQTFSFYEINFSAGGADRMYGCLLNSEDHTHQPYLDMRNMGWCAGCSYATMAVQTITWSGTPGGPSTPEGTPQGWARNYACYEFRGYKNYNVTAGVSTYMRDMNGDGKLDGSTSIVRKSRSGNPNDGNIAGHEYHSDCWTCQDEILFFCGDEWVTQYGCVDGWCRNTNWWTHNFVYPSPPYLRDMIAGYLQSNVMPVLDVRQAGTGVQYDWKKIQPKCEAKTISPAYYCSWENPPSGPYTSCPRRSPCWGSCTQGYTCTSSGTPYVSLSQCQASCSPSTNCQLTSLDRSVCNVNKKSYIDAGTCQTACNDYCDGPFSHFACMGLMPSKTVYAPLDLCTKYKGEGAAIYVVGDTSQIGSSTLQEVYPKDDMLIGYLGNDVHIRDAYEGTVYDVNGTGQIIARAITMKDQCTTPPLVGLAITEADRSLSTLVGQPGVDLLNPDDSRRGKLHKFFYKSTQMDYRWRVANGKVDSYPGTVDVLLQEWYPTCPSGIEAETNNRIEFSRALLSNFSKPSLIWKFHFPDGSNCRRLNQETGQMDYNYFMEYLFNNTGTMVDAGMMGVIYDSWITADGRGYGNPNTRIGGTSGDYPGGYTGLTLATASGRLDDPLAGINAKASTPFCAVQKNSKAILGLIDYTYGQKVYAQNVTCACSLCTDNDMATGRCDRDTVGGHADPTTGKPIPLQAYCNDGSPCKLPHPVLGNSDQNYSQYYCQPTCVNATACLPCDSSSFSGKKSICKVEQVGEKPFVANRSYSELNATTFDDDWAFVAGLPASAKCCVEKQQPDQPVLEYTYVSKLGEKQRSEFLQYPRRGEPGIDCGRTPDTSVLQYCGVRIPMSQQKIACFKVG